MEIIHAEIFSQFLLTNTPIFSLSLVNITSGTTAKLSCMERITWLNSKSSDVPFSPYKMETISAGITAINLVMSLRNQGFKRILRKPSITICPANVPVMVEFCPEARRAIAKKMLAKLVPKSGVSISWASLMPAIS